MKRLKYIALLTITLGVFSCGEEFLDTRNLYEQLDSDYYSNSQEVGEALTASYSCLTPDWGANNPTFLAILLADDNFGGGSDGDQHFHGVDNFSQTGEDLYIQFWETYYKGIFRANMIINRFEQADYANEEGVVDENQRNQDLGEAHFLRAYFYLKLAQFFGTVPLITDPAPVNLPKASPEDLFGQIASDLKLACDIMPSTKASSIPVSRLGHATKWAAEGILAKAFLFYTGYYKQTEIVLNDGSTLTKDQVASYLDDCVANSGHKLVSDYRNLWPYSAATGTEGDYVYEYAINNGLNWIGEEGSNTETLFAIKYSPYGGWNAPDKLSYSNQMSLYLGMRNVDGLYPFAKGWGGGPVSPLLWESFETGDIRREGSMINAHDEASIALEGTCQELYIPGNTRTWQETGLYQKKYAPIQVYNGKKLQGLFGITYNVTNFQLWNMQDEVLIRFADVLLMQAELKGDATPLNEVRARVGLDPVAYSLDAIKRERRAEFAFEGIRYFDLLRWHDAETAFGKLVNIPVKNLEVDATYNGVFRPETGGFLPIPESQILLSNDVLKQNDGWN